MKKRERKRKRKERQREWNGNMQVGKNQVEKTQDKRTQKKNYYLECLSPYPKILATLQGCKTPHIPTFTIKGKNK